eukprot:6466929-Amphidinium_carterae.1
MQERLPAVQALGVGAAQALSLSSVLIQSCARHALSSYAPSQAMRRHWHTMSRSLMAGPPGWTDDFLHVAKPLLGFPSSMMPVEVFAQLAQLSAIARAGGCASVGCIFKG